MNVNLVTIEEEAENLAFGDEVKAIMAHCPDQARRLAEVLVLQNVALSCELSYDPAGGLDVAAEIRVNRRLVDILSSIT